MAELTDEQLRERLKRLPGWELVGVEICKQYTFGDFKGAMAFANRVAALAEELDHHPDMLVQYGRVTLTLSSHDVGHVTERDLRLAAKVDG